MRCDPWFPGTSGYWGRPRLSKNHSNEEITRTCDKCSVVPWEQQERQSMQETQERKRPLSWQPEGRSSTNGGRWQSEEQAFLTERTACAKVLWWEKAKHFRRGEGGWEWLEWRQHVEQQTGEVGNSQVNLYIHLTWRMSWFQSLNNTTQGHITSKWLNGNEAHLLPWITPFAVLPLLINAPRLPITLPVDFMHRIVSTRLKGLVGRVCQCWMEDKGSS